MLCLVPVFTFAQISPTISLSIPYTTIAKGQSIPITWTAVDSDNTEYTVVLAGNLLSSPRLLGNVDTDQVENYIVKIPTDVPAGLGYTIQFVTAKGISYPSRAFSITGSNEVSPTLAPEPILQTEIPSTKQSTSTSGSTATTSIMQELRRLPEIVTNKITAVSLPALKESCTKLTTTIGYGVRNVDPKGEVILAQNFLFKAGYLPVKPTGFVGSKTVAAITKFQKDTNIRNTGVLGPITRAKIQQITCAQ